MSDTPKVDRDLQRRVLHALRDTYPNWPDIGSLPDHENPALSANLCYLDEHELIALQPAVGRNPWSRDSPVRITAKGLDFLEDDGGLSAILGTVTVKFAPDDLRALIAARVDSSPWPAAEKSRLRHALQSVPTKALQTFLDRFVREAVARSPDALQQLQTWLSQLS